MNYFIRDQITSDEDSVLNSVRNRESSCYIGIEGENVTDYLFFCLD